MQWERQQWDRKRWPRWTVQKTGKEKGEATRVTCWKCDIKVTSGSRSILHPTTALLLRETTIKTSQNYFRSPARFVSMQLDILFEEQPTALTCVRMESLTFCTVSTPEWNSVN